MKKFCVYFTVYIGNKLPPFYIGSSSVSRIKNGYRGSPSSYEYKKIWKNEKKENPHLFKTTIISTHYTREDAFIRENFIHEKMKVVDNPLYINKWYARVEKNFKPLIGKDNPMYGKNHSNETKEKIRRANVGRKMSNESKTKCSISQVKRATDNTWNQLSNDITTTYGDYKNLENEIIKLMKKFGNCPCLVANELGNITTPVIMKVCDRNGIKYTIDQRYTKIVKKYGSRWDSYESYEKDILNYHENLWCIEHIAKELNINSWGITEVLKQNNLTPNDRHSKIINDIKDEVLIMINSGISRIKIKQQFKITDVVIDKILSKKN